MGMYGRFLQKLGTGRVTGPNNHAGDLAPLDSPWGRDLFSHTGRLIAQPAPIGRQGLFGFGGTVGGFSSVSASVLAIAVEQGFGGDVPQWTQPILNDPAPWNRV